MAHAACDELTGGMFSVLSLFTVSVMQ